MLYGHQKKDGRLILFNEQTHKRSLRVVGNNRLVSFNDNRFGDDMNKTTKADFNLFVKECQYWIDKFGLKMWDVSFNHSDDIEDRIGNCQFDCIDRWAIISMAKDFGDTKPTIKEICSTAYHECLELLFAEWSLKSTWRFVQTELVFDEIRHKIIQTFVNTQFADDFKRRKPRL